jgi:hypothetical protein
VPQRQVIGHRVLAPDVAGEEGDALAVGAVARGPEVPFRVACHHRDAAAAQVDLGQGVAPVAALFLGRVEGEDDAQAVGRDVEGVGVGLGA